MGASADGKEKETVEAGSQKDIDGGATSSASSSSSCSCSFWSACLPRWLRRARIADGDLLQFCLGWLVLELALLFFTKAYGAPVAAPARWLIWLVVVISAPVFATTPLIFSLVSNRVRVSDQGNALGKLNAVKNWSGVLGSLMPVMFALFASYSCGASSSDGLAAASASTASSTSTALSASTSPSSASAEGPGGALGTCWEYGIPWLIAAATVAGSMAMLATLSFALPPRAPEEEEEEEVEDLEQGHHPRG